MRLLPVLSLLAPVAVHGLRPPWIFTQDSTQYWGKEDIKVPVQLGVMSRCPDALLCETLFNDVVQKASDKMDLSLVYVAKLDPLEPEFGVRCMHGPEECAGNVQQLCVRRHEPFAVWWQFVQCQNYEGRNKIGNPDITLKCAKTVGIDWENSRAGRCAGLDGSGKGIEGVGLLRESVILAEKMRIRSSCTVLINGRAVCIHDGTWKECDNGHTVGDFVRQIKEEYDKLNGD
ncbi:putative gamma interferon inducible lysosomal thiol reductase (GILT) [Lyophyllum shimeji]|uniref:Gamma interferon inducible lysosomal thiol reductase (GILT) n=1 Tax=Lyophyllum shimeji TaxID=47721 RepID=A0A9P3PDV6_LYOSH|nr:putative gamma interferon inducible lysosomal thiol reductase (GILT) [Lyophyllum shimeji]